MVCVNFPSGHIREQKRPKKSKIRKNEKISHGKDFVRAGEMNDIVIKGLAIFPGKVLPKAVVSQNYKSEFYAKCKNIFF